jgi:hypothetical protein
LVEARPGGCLWAKAGCHLGTLKGEGCGVRLGGFFTVVSGVRCVPPRRMRVVRALLMMSALIMFGSFLVMASSMGVMFRRLLVVFGSFL